MKPCQSIAMGLVVVGLRAAFSGYDALADPLGWLLVLLGVRGLPADLPRRRGVLWLAALAGLVSIPLWVPGLGQALDDTHASLLWAANLPQLAFSALLCHSLALRASAAGDGSAAAWLRFVGVGFVAFAALPVLVFGGGVTALEVPAYVGATLTLLLLVALLFSYAGRPWAARIPDSAVEPPASS